MSQKNGLMGIPTRLDEMNRLTTGLQKGDLIILAGRCVFYLNHLMKKATTVEEQINILKRRGMLIDMDEDKAKEISLDRGNIN